MADVGEPETGAMAAGQDGAETTLVARQDAAATHEGDDMPASPATACEPSDVGPAAEAVASEKGDGAGTSAVSPDDGMASEPHVPVVLQGSSSAATRGIDKYGGVQGVGAHLVDREATNERLRAVEHDTAKQGPRRAAKKEGKTAQTPLAEGVPVDMNASAFFLLGSSLPLAVLCSEHVVRQGTRTPKRRQFKSDRFPVSISQLRQRIKRFIFRDELSTTDSRYVAVLKDVLQDSVDKAQATLQMLKRPDDEKMQRSIVEEAQNERGYRNMMEQVSGAFEVALDTVANALRSETIIAVGAMLRLLSRELSNMTAGNSLPQFVRALRLFDQLQEFVFPPFELDGAPVTSQQVAQLTRYCRYAVAAYGRGLSSVFVNLDRMSFFKTDKQSFCNFANLLEDAVLAVQGDDSVNEQAAYLFFDHTYKEVIIAIRGTIDLHDIMTDLACETVPIGDDSSKLAHQGMLLSARKLVKAFEDEIEHALSMRPTYSLVVTGHSLGAGVGCMVAMLLAKRYPDIHCFGFGMPCALSLEAALELRDKVTSVILGHDVVGRLSLGAVHDLRATTRHIIEMDVKASDFFTPTPDGRAVTVNAVAAHEMMGTLRTMMKETKLYPPGRILWINSHHDRLLEHSDTVIVDKHGKKNIKLGQAVAAEVVAVRPEAFSEIIISPWLLRDHLPGNYIDALNNLASGGPATPPP